MNEAVHELSTLFGMTLCIDTEPRELQVENSTKPRMISVKERIQNKKLNKQSSDLVTPTEAEKIDCNSTVAIPNDLIEAKLKAKILKPLCFVLANANMIDMCNPDYRVLRMNVDEFLSALDIETTDHPTRSLRRVIDPIDKALDIFSRGILHITFLYNRQSKDVTIYHNIQKPDKFFSQLPYKIINNKLVSNELSTVYLALDYCQRTNKTFVSVEYISERAGLDVRKCRKLLKLLEQLKLVYIIKEKGKSNTYRLTHTDGTYLYTHIEYDPIFRP